MKSHLGRSSLRLQHYDYSQSGAYFVTICTHKKEPIFGQIDEDEIRLSEAGYIVELIWESLPNRYPNIQTDAFVVMPNHIHGIIMIKENNVGAIHAVSHRRAAGVAARTVNCPYINIDRDEERCCYRE